MDASGQLHLLVVEDDEIDREALRRLLGSNYCVHEAETAGQARAEIEAQRPDCVILDYRLPDMSGLDLVPMLAEQYIPVILSTGEESPRVIVESMQQGAQDYLVKGRLTRDALERAIHNAIEKVELRRHLADQREQLVIQAQRLAETNRQVRALASALALAEQRERRRVAQILHDHVQQMLYGVQMRTFMIGMDLGEHQSSTMQNHLAEMEELLNEAIQTTRTLTVELSPPVLGSEGLGAAFSWLANQMHKLHDLTVELQLADDYQLPSDDLRVLVFQLVRELLFNVVKHSQVDTALLSMQYTDGRLHVEVVDQGVGFDTAKLNRPCDGTLSAPASNSASNGEPGTGSGFGLQSIRERLSLFDGDMVVESGPGKGTRVVIELPYVEKPEKSDATDLVSNSVNGPS
ncbi:MAG: response regulator [Litorilinea sp.]